MAEASDVLVVCRPDSRERIAAIGDRDLRRFNRTLLARCEHRHIQAAVDAVETQRTNIYVLPGTYREQPSWDHPCTEGYDGGVVEYDLVVSCGEVINLVTVAGDDPADPDNVCDHALCNLQIEGTGATPEDVALVGGFRDDGDWVKHNGLKADRADGFYLANMTFELFRENAVDVHETDGYVLDDVVARRNDHYGILTFTSDHGLISDCETSYNGDSGVYPGSAADVNAQNSQTGRLDRWAVEITHNATSPLGLPRGNTGSLLPAGTVVKSAGLVPCATYNRETNPDPVGCDWMDSPTEPGAEGTEAAAAAVTAVGDGITATALSLLALLALGMAVRRGVRRT